MRDGTVFRVCGDMPSTSDGGQVHWHQLTALSLWAMLNTGNGHRLMEWHRGRCRHHKTEWLSSVFRDALPDKDFYDRPLTHRLNSIHRKEQCRNDGTFRSASLRHTSFYRGCTDFSFFSVPVHRRHRRVGDDLCFHGLSSGGAFSIKRTINKWVSTSCLP